MYTLVDSIAWSQAFVQFQPLTAGLGFEPALSIGNMIRDGIMYVGVWPWNRKEVTESITAGTQDYTFLVTDFGFLEKATVTDDQGKSYELLTVLNQDPLAAGNTVPGRPTAISIIDFVPSVSISVRLMSIPTATYTLTLTYQKLVTEFTADTVTQVIASSPTGGSLDQVGQNNTNASVSSYEIPASPITATENNEWAVSTITGGGVSSVGAGWVQLGSTPVYFQQFAGTSIQFGGMFTSPSSYCGVIATFFTSGTPSVTNYWATGFIFSTLPRSFTSILPNPVTTGDAVMVFITRLSPTGGVTTVTDNFGNVYTMLESSSATSRQAEIWYSPSVVGGALQVTISDTLGFASSGQITVIEVPALASGPTQYIGSFNPLSYTAGTEFAISGFVNPTNNGTFTVVSSDATHLYVSNTAAINETTSNGVAVIGDWSPIPENYKDIYNNLFLAEVYALVDDERSRVYRTRGMAALLGRASGLSETQKNIFTQGTMADAAGKASRLRAATQGAQGRAQ
jgi:hypothetical protein